MKKFKIDFLLVAALTLAGGMAVATTTKAPKSNVETQTWVRMGSISNPDDDQTWQPGSIGAECNAATKLCKGVFEVGYDPNDHDDTTNAAENQSGSTQRGYVQ